MRSLPFKLAPLLVAILAPLAQAQIITVGPNINISKLGGNQSETAIAINRLNTDLITVASNNIAASNSLFLRYSNNGGTSWNTSSFAPVACCDAWMGADSLGNMYMSYLTSGITTNIARSTDGGASYTNIAVVAGGSDHPELAIGPGAAAGTSSIFVRDTTTGNRVISGTSTGLGVTSGFTTTSGLGSGNFGSTAVGPGGRTAFTSLNPAGDVGPTGMTIRYDADGTGPGGYVIQSTISSNVGGFRFIPAQPNRSIDAQVDLKYDSSGGANNGSLYMLYTQAPNTTSNDTNIVFRKSTDNGATFSSEVKLNKDVGSNSQFFGRLAVDQKTGWLASVWYDARNAGAANNKVEVWGTVSTDGGTTWAPDFKISNGMTSCVRSTIGNDGNECGDYISMDFYDGKLVTAWADSSNSTGDNPNGTAGLDVYFSKILVTAAVPEPGTYAMFALGLLAIGVSARRKR
jgi:PEP-CTERM motif